MQSGLEICRKSGEPCFTALIHGEYDLLYQDVDEGEELGFPPDPARGETGTFIDQRIDECPRFR